MQVLDLVESHLKASGIGKERLLKVNVFLRSIDAGADEFNAVWDRWILQDHLPVTNVCSRCQCQHLHNHLTTAIGTSA